MLADLERRIDSLRCGLSAPTRPDLTRYRDDPNGFARDVLLVEPTPDQERIARAFLEAPYKVKVRAGHNVGKTFLFAWLTLWWFYTRPRSVVITTAPTERDVIDLLWTEVRLLHARARLPGTDDPLPDDFIGPTAPQMYDGPDHWAKGYTARKGESFQGRHRANMLFLFDEDDGLEVVYYDRTRMMFKPGDGHAWGSIGNPYSTSSASALEEYAVDGDGNPSWNLFTLSCLDHPNVRAELDRSPPPVPNAVSLAQVDAMVAEKCQPIPAGQVRPGDFEWPPGSGHYHRPGPLFEAGVLGRRPTQGTNSVWSEAAFDAACRANLAVPLDALPEVGCDVAVFGDDWTTIHVRCGPVSLHHEAANGWGPEETAGRLKQVCREYAAWANARRPSQAEPVRPEQVLTKVELDGYGEGVLSHGREWNWLGVSASGVPNDPENYPKRRSELWFTTADRAAKGRLDLSRLDKRTLARLRQQAMAPVYSLNGQGQMVVEEKKDTKKRLGRSPDDMDGVNQAYCEVSGLGAAEWVGGAREHRSWRDRAGR